MDKDLRLNSAQNDLCEMKTFGNLLWETIVSPYVKTFWVYFIVNIIVLFYHILYKWHLQSLPQLQLHLQSIRKHIGSVIGMFSYIISWKVVFDVEICYSSIYLVLFSWLLGAMAYFIAHGFKETSIPLLVLPICSIGLLILFPVNNYFVVEGGLYYSSQSLYGIFLLFLGVRFYLRDGDENITERHSRHRTAFPALTEVVINDSKII